MEINEFIQTCRQLEELQQTRTIMEECLVLRPSEITAVRKWLDELIRTQKAFELACKVLGTSDDICNGTEFKEVWLHGNCKECWKEYFLQKAIEKARSEE